MTSGENLSYAICEQQKRSSACASKQSDQHIVVRCLDCIIPLDAISGWLPSCRNKIPWLFTDQIQFFTDQNTAVLQPICLLAADKWQISFTSSLKCISLILQMKQIKSLNSLLTQNILKLTSFHSFEQNTCYHTYFGPKLWNSLSFLVFKISLTNSKIHWLFPDREEKSNFPDVSLTSGHPVQCR